VTAYPAKCVIVYLAYAIVKSRDRNGLTTRCAVYSSGLR